MFYTKILRVWVLYPLDIFLLIAIVGYIAAMRLKDYLAEKKATERLENSIIKKLELVNKSYSLISNSKEIRIKRVYRFALKKLRRAILKFSSRS